MQQGTRPRICDPVASLSLFFVGMGGEFDKGRSRGLVANRELSSIGLHRLSIAATNLESRGQNAHGGVMHACGRAAPRKCQASPCSVSQEEE